MLTNSSTDHSDGTEFGPAPDGAGAPELAPPAATRPHTAMAAGRQSLFADHQDRSPFRSAAHRPMRRNYAINRFLHLTAKYRHH